MGLPENIVKNLDKEELRHIKKDILANKDSQAKKLFELIEEYGEDEEKISARFKRLAPKGNIAVVRNQLQHLLLKGVVQLHADNYSFAEVNSLILQIRVFIDRSAFDVVKKLLDKALEIARTNELFTQWTDLIEIKLHLYQTKNYIEDDKNDDIMNEFETVCNKHENYIRYRRLEFEQMQLTNSSYQLRTEDAKLKWEKINDHDLLTNISKALSKKAEIEYWILRAQYNLMFYKYEEAKNCFLAMIDLFENNLFLKKTNSMNFLWAHSQLTLIGYFQKDTALMYRHLQAIKTADKFNDIENVAAFTYYTNYGMAYYDLVNDTPALMQLLDEAHAGLRIWIARIKPDARMALLVSCVSVRVESGLYEKALEMIHEFVEYIYTENRLDGKIVLLFYELIAQIESGNQLMVNDTLQNFNRYLLRHNFKSEFEQLMVRFLKTVSSNTPSMKEELSALKQQLLLLPGKPILDQHPVLYQILITMIDSRLAGMKYHNYMALSKQTPVA